jgi:hypothetical protein
MSVQSHQSQHHNRRRRPNVDVHIVNHHSIVLFHLTTPEASAWVEENVTAEAQFFGTALVVEPRCRRPHPRHARGRTAFKPSPKARLYRSRSRCSKAARASCSCATSWR